jgi:exodeoxyribonuclease VII small subunit
MAEREAPKFEDGLADLEKLVHDLEGGDLGLDEALKRFEGGVKLAGRLQKTLEESQRKVEKLAAGGLEAFDEDEDEAPGSAKKARPEPAEGKKARKKADDPSLF